MAIRRVVAITVCLAFVLGLCASPRAYGDVIVHKGGDASLNQLLERYSDTGVDLGLFASFQSESCDGLYSGANGEIYALANTLGYMTVLRYSPTGQSLATSSSPKPWESSALILRGSTLLMGSSPTSSSVSGALSGGIYSFNPQTLANNGSLFNDPYNQTVQVDNSFALSPSATTLYMSDNVHGIRALTIGAGSISSVPLFTLAASGALQVSADGSRLFVETNAGINWYSTNPADLSAHPFISTGTAGITSLTGFTLAPDGDVLVTARTTSGAELMLFNGSTGAFINQLAAITPPSNGFGGAIAYVPECDVASVAPLITLLSVAVRRRKRGD